MATQNLKAIGSLKLGRASKAPTKITITNPVGDSALFKPEATSSEQVALLGANDILIGGDVTISYTPIPKSKEVDNVVVSGITAKAVEGSTIVAWGTDGIMSLTPKVTAVV